MSSRRSWSNGEDSKRCALGALAGFGLALLVLAASQGRAEETAREVRAQANAARTAVQAGDPQAAVLLETAWTTADRLPPEDPSVLAIRLHILRSRMLHALPGAGADSGGELPEPEEIRSLTRALEMLAGEARARAAFGPRAFSLFYLAELAAARGDRASALSLAEQVLLVPESDATWEAQVAAEAFRERHLLSPDESAEALRGLRRARLMLERVRLRVDAALHLARARPIHERLAGRLLALARTRPGDSQTLLREALDALEDLKRAELREYFGDPCLAGLDRTTPERLPDALLVYPVVLEDRVELIVSREGALVALIAPITPAELQVESRRLRGALQDPTSPRYRAPAARLYDALIRPLETAAGHALGDPSPSTATLVFVPTGALREIPIAALFDERTSQFLVEQMAIATLPSLRILPPRALDPRRSELLAVGLSEAVEDFAALPFTTRELDAVTRRFSSTKRVDAAFSKAGFAAAFDERPFDIVHIASHGRFDAQASESFLVAHDGRLTLAELADLIGRTRHRTRRPLELLVLSACETAIGDERAVLGLAGVAVQSGARSAVASLWKVHDEATMELFTTFYRELGRPGVTRAEALRRAQRALLAEKRFRHPIYWSAFLLVNGWL